MMSRLQLAVLYCALACAHGLPRGSDYGSGKGTAGSNAYIGTKDAPTFYSLFHACPTPRLALAATVLSHTR